MTDEARGKLTMAASAAWPACFAARRRRGRRNQATSRRRATDWADLALGALAIEGVDHVTVLGLKRTTWRVAVELLLDFKNRDQLLDALLERWDRLNTHSIVSEAEAPAATVNEAVCNVFRCWVNPLIFSPRLDFALREWARRSAHVRKALDRSDQVRMEALKALFVRFGYEDEDAFVRARVLYYMQSAITRSTSASRSRRASILRRTISPLSRA